MKRAAGLAVVAGALAIAGLVAAAGATIDRPATVRRAADRDPTPIQATPTQPPSGQPPPNGRFSTLPVGTPLPSGADCAARVRPMPEIRPGNHAANHTRGQGPNARNDWAGFARVDGDFVGTTDEIIQWAACKWGIDEDIVRAQVVKESWWHQSAVGDVESGEPSYGLGQVRQAYHGTAFPWARTSSAYNLDYTYASWRACYEGVYTWLNTAERGRQYAAGDEWGCLGVWYSGRWYTEAAIRYIEGGDTPGYGDMGVRQHLANTTWDDPDFLAG